MSIENLIVSDTNLISHYVQNAPQMMWFFGAGTSRTAGMPTATDIIWDLKRQYYCLKENQDIQNHDLHNESVKRKIQSYMDSKNFPALWSPGEYSFYFNLSFEDDYAKQQKYLNEQLSSEKISLNVGQRVIAALLKMGKARLVFTTNFDSVIERAYAAVVKEDLTAFHLEGSYAALHALNSENFPIYAKIHGDFRYHSIKNLSKDLIDIDEQIQKCFLVAATRYGLIVSGYSGRDSNVMQMFNQALEQNNPFPHGLYWTVTQLSDVSDSVRQFVEKARSKEIAAYIVEAGTFDTLLSKIWRQTPNKPENLDKNVRTAIAQPVSIPLPPPSNNGYPILRTNALLISDYPYTCATVDTKKSITFSELKEATRNYLDSLISVKAEKILAWGRKESITTALSEFSPTDPVSYEINNPVNEIKGSTIIKSFFEEALAHALINSKPLCLHKNRRQFFAVVDHKKASDPVLQLLKRASGYKDSQGQIFGSFGNNVFWAEAVSIKLEERNGQLWLLLRPDVWVKPLQERQNYREQIKAKKRYRFNQKAFDFLSAWVTILLGGVGGDEIIVEHLSDTEFPIKFTINSRSAFSRKEGQRA